MCSKFLRYLIELKVFIFLKKLTTQQHYRQIVVLNVVMVIGLFFAGKIYRAEGIIRLFIIFIAIISLVVGIFNYIKGLMLSQGDWQYEFVAFYYCLWLIILTSGLLILIYKFFYYFISFLAPMLL